MQNPHEGSVHVKEEIPGDEQGLIETILEIFQEERRPTTKEIELVKGRLVNLEPDARKHVISRMQKYVSEVKIKNGKAYLDLFLEKDKTVAKKEAKGYAELFVEDLTVFLNSEQSNDDESIMEKYSEYGALPRKERAAIILAVRQMAKNTEKYATHPLIIKILGKERKAASAQKKTRSTAVGPVSVKPVTEEGSEGGDKMVEEPVIVGEAIDTPDIVTPTANVMVEEKKEEIPEAPVEQEEKVEEKKKVVEYLEFDTLRDVVTATTKIATEQEKDESKIDTVVKAARVLFRKITAEIATRVEGADVKDFDAIQLDINKKIEEFKILRRQLISKKNKYAEKGPSQKIMRMFIDLTNAASASISTSNKLEESMLSMSSMLRVVSREKEAEEKKPKEKKYQVSKDADTLLNQIINREAGIMPIIQEVTLRLGMYSNKNPERSKQTLKNNMTMLKEAQKEIKTLIQLMESKGIAEWQSKYVHGYIERYIIRSLLTLKARFISFGRKEGEVFEPDAALTVVHIGDNPKIQEGILGLIDDKEVTDLLQEMSQSIDTILDFAKEKGMKISLDEYEVVNRGEKEKEIKYPEEKETAKKEEKEEIPEAPVEQGEKVEEVSESTDKPAKSIEDFFKPRDFSNPVPENIKNDEGFNTWLTNILEAYPEIRVSKETENTEEDYFAIYEKQKPFITEIKSALDEGIMDHMFSGLKDEDLKVARQLWFNQMQYAFLKQANEVGVAEFVNKTRELIAQHKIIKEKEAILQKKLVGVPAEDGKVPAEDVYLSLNNDNPEDARLREFEAFVQDVENNYNFYRGGSQKEDIQKMYRRYKHSHAEKPHQQSIGILDGIKARLKARFGSDQDDAQEVEKFAKNIYMMQELRIVELNKTDDPKRIKARREELAEYLKIARTAVHKGEDPLGDTFTFINLEDARNRKIKAGQELFKKLYKPYTDRRATDADMQARAQAQRVRAVNTTTLEQEEVNAAKQSFNSKVKDLRNAFTDTETKDLFYDQVKLSVATKKLRELEEKLKEVKPVPKEARIDSKKTIPKNLGQLNENEKLIAHIKTLFAYVRDAFDNADPEAVSVEQQLLDKKVSLQYIQVMTVAEGILSGESRSELAKNIRMYEAIAADQSIPNQQRINTFNILIQELTRQLQDTSLKPLQIADLKNVIKKFIEIRDTIPVPSSAPKPAASPAAQENSKKRDSNRH